MATYQVEVKAYEIDEWDEEREEPILGKVETYRVFSTIQVGRYTLVRAVVESVNGNPADPRACEWFVEWSLKFNAHDVGSTHRRMTRKMPRAKALREGERLAALIDSRLFANHAEFETFFADHRPTGSVYG